MVQGWKEFFKMGKWRQQNDEKSALQIFRRFQKSDWVVLALVGVLLLVIAMPLETGKSSKQDTSARDGTPAESTADGRGTGGTGGGSGTNSGYSGAAGEGGEVSSQEEYVAYLENKLETVLSQMEGVGKVEVMTTVSDAGEYVVEKDKKSTATVTSESDSSGGNRTVSENNEEEQTIYVDTGDETYPYVQKEKLPTVEGVVVVAEGGGNSVVVSNISESVKALLPVEAHRIKVVKMCSKEE